MKSKGSEHAEHPHHGPAIPLSTKRNQGWDRESTGQTYNIFSYQKRRTDSKNDGAMSKDTEVTLEGLLLATAGVIWAIK